MHRGNPRKNKKGDFKTLRNYVHKVARAVDSSFDVTHDNVCLLDRHCIVLVDRILQESARLLNLRSVPTETITEAEVRTAVMALYNTDLGKVMVAAGDAAVKLFNDNKGSTSAKRSGLVLAPPRVRKYIKQHHYSPRKNGTVHVFVTAAVEAVLRKIYIVSMTRCREKNRKTLKRQHVECALRTTPDLASMFRSVDVPDTPRNYGLAKSVDEHKIVKRKKSRTKAKAK